MSETHDESSELVRRQDFPTSEPLELDLSNTVGPIAVELSDSGTTHVEVRHDPNAGFGDWRSPLTGLLSWVSEQLGEAGIRTGGDKSANEPITEAVRQTRMDLSGSRLVVRTPSTMPLRTVPLGITVRAASESQISVQTGAGPVTVTGSAGRVQIQSGSGAITLDRATGPTTIRTGSGQLQLGPMTSGIQARSGSGDIEIASIEAPSSVVTGSGNVWLGAVSDDVLVRSGSGNITLTDTASGQAELITGSGDLQVSLRHGVLAEVDLTSSTGTANSELPIAEEPPDNEPTLRIYGRTGTGEALVSSAP